MAQRDFTILIDPGHGGNDPGAPSLDPIEAKINLAVARELTELLRDEGIRTYPTRLRHNQTVSLDDRVDIEHKLLPALTVSLHCNAAPSFQARGIEIWTSPGHTPSDRAAEHILSAVEGRFPERTIRRDLSDGDSDKEARFRVLTGTIGPAVLLEMGFVSNIEERFFLERISTQYAMAEAIRDGILAWRDEVMS